MREGGGTDENILKGDGRGHKDFKKGGQAGSRGGALKRGGLEPPYELCHHYFLFRNPIDQKFKAHYKTESFPIQINNDRILGIN